MTYNNNMRKLYLLPAAALMLATGACSSDDPVVEIPNDPITLQPATVDAPMINTPNQITDYDPDGEIVNYPQIVSGVSIPYDNGQIITYTLAADESTGTYTATVRFIEGTAEDVVIPRVLHWSYNREPQDFQITAFNLPIINESEGCPVGDNVKSITLPKECVPARTSSNIYKNDDFAMQLCRGKNLQNVYLETGYPNFCSIDGAVYSADAKTLVAVPSGRTGQFTAATGTETIAAHAFNHCTGLQVITLPASVTSIEEEAFLWTEGTLVINILSAKSPKAPQGAFGDYAAKSVIRVPAAAFESYSLIEPVKPERPADLVEPAMPEMPGDDATDDDWNAYDAAMEEYDAAYALYEQRLMEYEAEVNAYNTAYKEYEQRAAYKALDIEPWDFTYAN